MTVSGQRHGGGGSGGGSLEESPLQGLLDTWGWLLWARVVSIDAAGWHAHLVPDVETEASVWPVSGPKQHKQQQWGCEHSLSPSDDVSYLLSPSPVPHPIPDARWARGWVFPVFELTDGFHPGSQRDTGFWGSHERGGGVLHSAGAALGMQRAGAGEPGAGAAPGPGLTLGPEPWAADFCSTYLARRAAGSCGRGGAGPKSSSRDAPRGSVQHPGTEKLQRTSAPGAQGAPGLRVRLSQTHGCPWQGGWDIPDLSGCAHRLRNGHGGG